jgi:hypothetical protein
MYNWCCSIHKFCQTLVLSTNIPWISILAVDFLVKWIYVSTQGEQIGRFFPHCQIVSTGHFTENLRSWLNLCALLHSFESSEKWFGPRSGRFFSQTHLVTLPPTSDEDRQKRSGGPFCVSLFGQIGKHCSRVGFLLNVNDGGAKFWRQNLRVQTKDSKKTRAYSFDRSNPGMPDGLFSNQKSQIGVNFVGSCNGKCWYIICAFCLLYGPLETFYGHLV